jgi:hypothetical protein
MPLEIGVGEGVEIIDCKSDEILNSGKFPGHGEDNLVQNLAGYAKRSVACLDSTDFFPVEYHKRLASFLLHNSTADFSDFRRKHVPSSLNGKIEQRPIWSVNLLQKGEHAGDDEKKYRV